MANGFFSQLGKGFGEGVQQTLPGAVSRGMEIGSQKVQSSKKIESALQSYDEVVSNLGAVIPEENQEQFQSSTKLGREIINRGGNIDEALKAINASTKLQKELGGVTTPQEGRLEEQQSRLLRQERVGNIESSGSFVKEGEFENFRTETGLDPDAFVEAYGLKPRIDKEGYREYFIPPRKELDRKISQRTFAPSEVEHINDLVTVRDNMRSILSDMRGLGINEISEVGIFSDLGKFSIPAKFDLIAQFSKNPEYVDLKRRLERVFQSYRKLVTGAQASDRELRMLRPLINAFTDQPGVFFKVGQSIVDESDRLHNNRLNLYDSVGRDTTALRKNLEELQTRATKSSKKLKPEPSKSEASFSNLWE